MLIKRYKMCVFAERDGNEIQIAEIKACWTPEDPEAFTWELGGTRMTIEELPPIDPLEHTSSSV